MPKLQQFANNFPLLWRWSQINLSSPSATPGTEQPHLFLNSFVLAAASWPTGAVVAGLAQCHAALCREVAKQAGQEKCQDAYGRPPHAAMRLGAGEGLVCTHILIVARAVVEQAFDAADASHIVHCRCCGANAPVAAHPTGGQGSRAGASLALAAATVLAENRVLAIGLLPAGCCQRLQFLLLVLGTFRLRPHHPIACSACVSQKSLIR